MITDTIRQFIEAIPVAIVASTGDAGYPHLAAASGLRVPDGSTLLFENWSCETTLQNVSRNPQVAVAVTAADGQAGYQIVGRVRRLLEEAVLNGYAPDIEEPGTPQALFQLEIEVEKVMEFSVKMHSDRDLG